MTADPGPQQSGGAESDGPGLKQAFLRIAFFVAALWVIRLSESALGMDLTSFGVFPRRADGLPGILTAPLVHGSLAHLFANTGPLLVLGTALLYGYPKASRILLPAVYFGSGLGVWLFARTAYHLGASGLTLGMLVFVFTVGVLRWDRRAIALALIVSFLYGGAIWGILPGNPEISYEYHASGATIGAILAVLLRNLDPPPPEKKYSWEDEEPSEDEMPEWDDALRRPNRTMNHPANTQDQGKQGTPST